MPSISAFKPRLAAAATAVALTIGAAACGGSDEEGSSASEEQQVRATVERLYDAIAAGNPERVCAQMTKAAQDELAAGGLGSKTGSCAESYGKFLAEAEKAGGLNLTLKAKVKSVKVTDDSAVAKINFGGGPTGEMPLAKVDGEWKVEAAGATPKQ